MSISQPPFQSTLVDANDRVQTPWAQWFSQLQPILQSVVASGPTSGRPTQNLYIGYPYFDTTIDQMVYWNGVIWVTYAPSTTGTSILKGNGSGGFNNAIAGVDFAPATSGNAILYGNGAGGFSSVSIGSGVTFAGGVLSATGSGGTVTSVTGTAPITSSGGNTPAISISQAGASTNGYLSSTDWNIFNSKAPATSGTAILYGDGAGGFSNVTIGSGVTFVAGTLSATGSGGTVTAVTGSGNIASSGGTTPNITFTGTLPIANGGTNGTATPTAGAVAVGNGTQYAFTAAGSAGQVLTSNGSTVPTWATVATGIGTTGYWGSFWDTTNQTAASTTVAYTINIGTSDPNNNGVSIASSNRITVAYAGVYNIQYSIQFENIGTGNKNYNVDVWFRLNGVDISDSNSTYWIASKNSTVNGELIAAVNYVLSLAAGDYVQLMWAVSDVDISIATLPATSSPTVPRTPGVIVTVTPITEVGIGYYNLTSVSSVAIATGSKTFTTNLSNISTAFTVGTRIRVAYVTTPTNYMEGVITSFSGTTLVVNVDSIGGSGTYANWTISVAGIQGSNGVTSITGTANQVIASASTGAVTLSLPQNINSGAAPTFLGTNFTGIPNAGLTNSSITINGTATSLGGSITVGTVTSVGFTGGLITVATPTTTPAFTVAGTSGGIPYFSSASTWATSAALALNSLVIGGGAGAAPVTTTTGTGVLTALGTNVGSAGAFVTFNGALGTPSSGTVTNLTGTASININGTVGATTATTGKFTTLEYTSTLTGGTGIVAIGTNQIYKDASGNVGIGTSSPTNSAGYGTLSLSGATGGQLVFQTSGTYKQTIYSTGTDLNILNSQAGIVTLGTNNTERMRIDSSGNVGIGVIPAVKLDVNISGATNTMRIGDYTAAAASTLPIVESFGNRQDANGTFFGRFGASKRRSDGTAIPSGQAVGVYAFGGQWGTDTSYQSAKHLYAASIMGVSESSFTSATTMSTGIVFNTGSAGAALSAVNTGYGTERMRITSTGGVNIGASTDPGLGNLNIVGATIVGAVTATSAAAPTIASATTIAPTKAITFISGVTPIVTITPPSPISLGGGTITLIPTGIFTTTIAGNIALASTAVVGRALTMTYDVTTTKWYPSY